MTAKKTAAKKVTASKPTSASSAVFTVEDGIVKVTVGGVTVTLNGPAAGCSTTEE